MGLASSCARRPSLPLITERDVLTLCDDGDLLLLREHVVHTELRVAIDKRVAQDITAFEGGVFPTARVTRLPAWTSCALLLRVSGTLHILEVDLDGVRLVAFQERVAQRSVHRDTYAVRRLQHVRNDETSSFFRQLTFELSHALPLVWTHDASDTVQSKERILRGHVSLGAAVHRMLQLCDFGLPKPPTVSSPVDRAAQMSTAFVIAVYEQLRLLAPLDETSHVELLTPSSLGFSLPNETSSSLSSALRFTPANALGTEMRLV